MNEVLLPAESQRFAAIRHYGLLLFVATSFALTLITLVTLMAS